MDDTNQKDMLIIETMVKLAAVNKILIKRGILTDDEIHQEMTEISKNLVDQVKKLTPDIFGSITKN